MWNIQQSIGTVAQMSTAFSSGRILKVLMEGSTSLQHICTEAKIISVLDWMFRMAHNSVMQITFWSDSAFILPYADCISP